MGSCIQSTFSITGLIHSAREFGEKKKDKSIVLYITYSVLFSESMVDKIWYQKLNLIGVNINFHVFVTSL